MTHLEFLPQFPFPDNPLALFGLLLLAGPDRGRTRQTRAALLAAVRRGCES